MTDDARPMTAEKQRILQIQNELAQLRASLPAHSLQPSMLARIEDELNELSRASSA